MTGATAGVGGTDDGAKDRILAEVSDEALITEWSNLGEYDPASPEGFVPDVRAEIFGWLEGDA
ncbi:MAG: hypothetical protein JXX28_08200 [Deltaproteobacteria bacterium]|nr:hypothetical protein [Deltaproteobacteria bacterium]